MSQRTARDAALEEHYAEPRYTLRAAAGIAIERQRWVWDGRVPVGAVTLEPGRQGLGKSTLAGELGARLSRGQLDGDFYGEPCDVLVIGHEDALATVIVPRLIAAGADLARFWFLTSTDPRSPCAFTVPGDVAALETLLAAQPGIRLVIIDPLDAHLGGIDTFKKADTQRAIGTLALLAQRCELAVLGIAHLTKGGGTDPLDRVTGSAAFTTASRSVLSVAEHPDRPDERVIVSTKANLTDRGSVAPLAFRIEGREVSANGVTVPTSGVVWLGVADIDPDAVLVPRETDDEHGAAERAAGWLLQALADGPVRSQDVKRWARESDISERTLARARVKIGAETADQKTATGRHTVWHLPGDLVEPDETPEGGCANPGGTTPMARPPKVPLTSTNGDHAEGVVPTHGNGTTPPDEVCDRCHQPAERTIPHYLTGDRWCPACCAQVEAKRGEG